MSDREEVVRKKAEKRDRAMRRLHDVPAGKGSRLGSISHLLGNANKNAGKLFGESPNLRVK